MNAGMFLKAKCNSLDIFGYRVVVGRDEGVGHGLM